MSTQTQSCTASRFSAKTLTMCAIFTALVAVCSQITIPLPIIPINLALFAVYLAGALLGPWRGALSLLVYLLLAAVGVPVMAGFRGGLGNLVGNTGGYVVGYIFAAFFTGLLVEKRGRAFLADVRSDGAGLRGVLFLRYPVVFHPFRYAVFRQLFCLCGAVPALRCGKDSAGSAAGQPPASRFKASGAAVKENGLSASSPQIFL